jgi:hypothetical protein
MAQVKANVFFPDDSQAVVAERRLSDLFNWAEKTVRFPSENPGAAVTVIPKLLAELEFAFSTAQVERKDKEVRVLLRFKTDLSAKIGETIKGLQESAVALVRETPEQQRSRCNLHQLALAMSNYGDKNNNELPPAAILGKDGGPLLSWRVAILPYIGENDLYQVFKLDEPWDSAHNKKLLKKMPEVFASPHPRDGQEPFTTFYQVFVGPKGEAPFELGRRPRFPGDFTDGVLNTLLIVEALESVPWTKPADIPYSNKAPVPKLGGIFRDGFNAAMADQKVRFIKRTVSADTLRAAITPAGNDMLGDDWDK